MIRPPCTATAPKAAEAGARAMRALQQAVYSDRDSSHARYQKRCYLVRPQRRLVPVEESLEVTALLDEYMREMSALPEDARNRFAGRDMFDVMRQYITEYFNMHIRALFEAYLRRGADENARAEFEGHAALLERLLTELEWMTREDAESYVETMVRRYEGRPCDRMCPERTACPPISAHGCETSARRLPRPFRT